MQFTSLQLGSGEELPIAASFHAASIGGAAAGGAIQGRIVGQEEGDGTAIGAVVGAEIGTAIAASTEGQEVMIPAGMRLQIQLDFPIKVTA